MKNKWIKYTLIIVLVIVAVVGGKVFMDQQAEKEMIRIVHSDEAKKVFEEGLKNIDERAFSKDGIVQSYEIDEKSIKPNPMGGTMVDAIINDDKKLKVYFILGTDNLKQMDYDIMGYSSMLDELLKQRKL